MRSRDHFSDSSRKTRHIERASDPGAFLNEDPQSETDAAEWRRRKKHHHADHKARPVPAFRSTQTPAPQPHKKSLAKQLTETLRAAAEAGKFCNSVLPQEFRLIQ